MELNCQQGELCCIILIVVVVRDYRFFIELVPSLFIVRQVNTEMFDLGINRNILEYTVKNRIYFYLRMIRL